MSAARSATPSRTVRSLVPARLDRLPWTRYHWLIIIGLGVSWVLDGLEIQIAATVGTVLQDRATLHLSSSDVGLMGSVYLFGEASPRATCWARCRSGTCSTPSGGAR